MPELPDVEVYRQRCNESILKKKIEDVLVTKSKVLKTSSKALKQLKDTKFNSASRHGKYLFLRTDKKVLVLHFGMTGRVSFNNGNNKNQINQDHALLTVRFSDDSKFFFINIRKLGKIYLTDDAQGFIKQKGLGTDAASLKKEEFAEKMQGKGSLKSKLMNQGSIAGLGNVYSDEILYQARIHPEQKTIEHEEITILYNTMKRVLKTAIRNKADSKRFPRRYLTTRRKQGEQCGICNGYIRKKTISGRSSYYCGRHQR